MKPLVQRVFYAKNYEQGLRQGRKLIARFKDNYSSAMDCLEDDLEECLTYLKFPEAHWRATRTTNILQGTFGEGRRRTKVIPRFPIESSGLRLLYASLIIASQNWHGVKMTPDI
jgi:transposase-like protein